MQTKSNLSSKKELKFTELAEKWVNYFLSESVLDIYALSYEKSRRKSDEQKRANKKYKKYFLKAEVEIKTKLKDRLIELFETSEIKKEDSEERIKEAISKILKSELRATRLCKVIKDFDFSKKKEKIKVEKNNPVEKVAEPKKPKRKEKTKIIKDLENDLKKDFFDKYDEKGTYFDPRNASEFRILEYIPELNQVKIYHYQKFVFDQENEAWDLKEKGWEENLEIDNFIELVDSYISDKDNCENDLVEIEKELLEKFNKSEQKVLVDLVLYVFECEKRLDDFLGQQDRLDEENLIQKKSEYMERFWEEDLPRELDEFENEIDLGNKVRIIEYLKFKKQN